MVTANWAEALEQAEQVVDNSRDAVRRGTEPPLREPWPELGPIPPELVLRAHELLTATVDAYAEIDALRGRLLLALNSDSPVPAACFLDTRL